MRLADMGYAVFVVPELATLTITGGASPGTYSRDQFVAWETAILRQQLQIEDMFGEIAQNCAPDRHAVLLCDRGTMDVLAYLGKEAFDEVCEENGWTVPGLRDRRYNAVVHLVTAADGAEKFYTLENNKARRESAEEAKELDRKLCQAWVGHNSLHIIHNSGSFEEKMVRVTAAVCDALGVPGPRAPPRWWIVKQVRPMSGVDYAEWVLEHTFLKTARDGIESRITKKSSAGNVVTYHMRISGQVVDGEHSQSEKILSYREYKTLLLEADPERTPIKKIRRGFVWHSEYYMLDYFITPEAANGVMTLFVENPVKSREAAADHIPPFLELVQDVTEKNWFSSHAHDSWKRTQALAEELTSSSAAAKKKPPPARDAAAAGRTIGRGPPDFIDDHGTSGAEGR